MSDLLFNEFSYPDETALFIIGNGFDIAHGMKTGWSDFNDWLYQNGYGDLVDFLDNNLNIDGILWKDFENGLGRYNLDGLYDYCTSGIHIDFDHMMRSSFLFEDTPDIFMPEWKNRLDKAFNQWIADVKLPSKPLNLDIPENARFLSFNYTNTLEHLYCVQPNNVLHIHGSIANLDVLRYGHNRQEERFYFDETALDFENTAKEKIVGEMNKLRKDVQYIAESNSNYWNSLSNIERIRVFGHSYNNIDMPYFQRIKKSVRQDCKWILGWHNDDDQERVNKMVRSLKLDSANCITVHS